MLGILHVSLVVAVIALSLLASQASAQALRFGVGAGQLGDRLTLDLSELDLVGVRVSLHLAAEPAGALQVGVGARRTLPIVPIGNVVLEGAAYASSRGELDLFAQGRGTIATVAARVRLEAFNVAPGRFDLTRLAEAETRPHYQTTGSLGLRLATGFTYRLDRFLVLVAEPELAWLLEQGFGGGLGAALQLRRLVESDDGHVLLFAGLEPGGEAGFVASGFEYRVNRPDWPTLRAAALLGAGGEGIRPGFRLSLGDVVEAWSYTLGLALEPYRRPGPRYLATTRFEGPLGPGTLDLVMVGGLGLGGVSTGYSVRF
jgi:hypothetical protein